MTPFLLPQELLETYYQQSNQIVKKNQPLYDKIKENGQNRYKNQQNRQKQRQINKKPTRINKKSF